jgi:hypothetical protein
MVAQAEEKKLKPSFGVKSADARKYFDTLSLDWL